MYAEIQTTKNNNSNQEISWAFDWREAIIIIHYSRVTGRFTPLTGNFGELFTPLFNLIQNKIKNVVNRLTEVKCLKIHLY